MARPHDDIFTSLALPFEEPELKFKPGAGGRYLDYITDRTAANRLDDVLGPANWWDEYVPLDKVVICKLTIRLPDGTTVTKSNAGAYADMADEGDGEKGGFSDAFKRAAAKFGVGRHLYGDGVPEFVRFSLNRMDDPSLKAQPKGSGGYSGRPSNGGGYSGSSGSSGRAEVNRTFQPSNGNGNGGGSAQGQYGDPKTGGQLFAWAKKLTDENPSLNLVKRIDEWAKKQDFPYKWKEWNDAQVAAAFAVASRVIQAPAPAPQTAPVIAGDDGDEEDIPF